MSADMITTIKQNMDAMLDHQQIRDALYFLKADNDQTTADQITLTGIEAPPFQEEERAAYFKEQLQRFSLEDIETDKEGNVFGIRRGSGNGPTLVVAAHLDTVFPAGTNVKAKIVDGKVYAPGISDDGRGLAVLLTLLRAFEKTKVETEGDIIFLADVGEEGLGDLRGVKAFFRDHADIDGFISIEPGSPGETIYRAVGSKRYKVRISGPGGHSFGDFGAPSAIHAVGRAIAAISKMEVPSDPKTTFNVGTIDGGTSINTIAQEAGFYLDLRSVSEEALDNLEKQALLLIEAAADEESSQAGQPGSVKASLTLVGDRPAGSQSPDVLIRQTALAAAESLGVLSETDYPSSTDSNVPISLGIPAVTLGGGGDFGGCHTLEEFFDPADAFYGPQRVFLTIIALAGMTGNFPALLEKRNN